MAGVGQGHLGGGRRRGLTPSADINVTSLVDVAFVLLIIFMITAPIMQGGVEVQLPRAEARPLSPREGVTVSIDRRGTIFVDDTEISYNDFRSTFGALARSRQANGVYLRADGRAAYGQVVRVLAAIRESGVVDVNLVTEDERLP